MLTTNESLLKTTPDQVKLLYEKLNTTEKSIEEMCNNLKLWYGLQPHLPQPPPDSNVIKTLLIACKLSSEKVKSKLDARCVLRLLKPEFFKYSDLIKCGFDTISKNTYWFPLPKLTDDLYRINIMKINGNIEEFSLEAHFKRSFMFGDYRLKNERCLADIYILDLENVKWAHLTKINPVTIKNAEISNKKAYGLRLAGIYIINAPAFIDKLLAILKRSLKPKLVSRIKCFSTLDDLYKDVPKSVLPQDYGGDEKSLNELYEAWFNELTSEAWKRVFSYEETLVSDESKRLNSKLDEDLLGMQGSFRKLDLD